MGRTETEKKVEGNGTAKLIAYVVAALLTGGGAGNLLGGINWQKETKDNSEAIAALKADLRGKDKALSDRLARVENGQEKLSAEVRDGFERIMERIAARQKGEGQ